MWGVQVSAHLSSGLGAPCSNGVSFILCSQRPERQIICLMSMFSVPVTVTEELRGHHRCI